MICYTSLLTWGAPYPVSPQAPGQNSVNRNVANYHPWKQKFQHEKHKKTKQSPLWKSVQKSTVNEPWVRGPRAMFSSESLYVTGDSSGGSPQPGGFFPGPQHLPCAASGSAHC